MGPLDHLLTPLRIKPNLPGPREPSATCLPHTTLDQLRVKAIPPATGAPRVRVREVGAGGVAPVLPPPPTSGPGETSAAKGRESGCACGRRSRPTPLAGLECQTANPSLKLANFHACSGISLKFPNKPLPGSLSNSLACTWSKFGSRSRGSPRHTCHFSHALSVRPSFPGPEHPHCPDPLPATTHTPHNPPGPPLGRSPSSPPSCCCRPYP